MKLHQRGNEPQPAFGQQRRLTRPYRQHVRARSRLLCVKWGNMHLFFHRGCTSELNSLLSSWPMIHCGMERRAFEVPPAPCNVNCPLRITQGKINRYLLCWLWPLNSSLDCCMCVCQMCVGNCIQLRTVGIIWLHDDVRFQAAWCFLFQVLLVFLCLLSSTLFMSAFSCLPIPRQRVLSSPCTWPSSNIDQLKKNVSFV